MDSSTKSFFTSRLHRNYLRSSNIFEVLVFLQATMLLKTHQTLHLKPFSCLLISCQEKGFGYLPPSCASEWCSVPEPTPSYDYDLIFHMCPQLFLSLHRLSTTTKFATEPSSRRHFHRHRFGGMLVSSHSSTIPSLTLLQIRNPT
jgi:hypothetical protein